MEASRSTLATRHKAEDAYTRLGSIKGAAKEVNKNVSYVKRWVARHEHGMGMGDLPRAGGPSFSLNNDDAIDIITACMLDRQGPIGMPARIKAYLRLELSPETVRRFVKQYMGRPLRATKKPLPKETHKKDRLRFAKRWVRRDWGIVVVTDSKYLWLCLRGAGSKWWAPCGMDADYVPAEQQLPKGACLRRGKQMGQNPAFGHGGHHET
jgi:hypothetical protein